MVIEMMLISGVGFSVVCGVALTGAVDKGAEGVGLQEDGEYEKWKNKNEFQIQDLVDVPDFIDDVKDETSWIVDWKKSGEEEGSTRHVEDAAALGDAKKDS